jgi:hypothetical protein
MSSVWFSFCLFWITRSMRRLYSRGSHYWCLPVRMRSKKSSFYAKKMKSSLLPYCFTIAWIIYLASMLPSRAFYISFLLILWMMSSIKISSIRFISPVFISFLYSRSCSEEEMTFIFGRMARVTPYFYYSCCFLSRSTKRRMLVRKVHFYCEIVKSFYCKRSMV